MDWYKGWVKSLSEIRQIESDAGHLKGKWGENEPEKFAVGDVVKLKWGDKPQVITENLGDGVVTIMYLEYPYTESVRKHVDYVRYSRPLTQDQRCKHAKIMKKLEEKEEENTMEKLYAVDTAGKTVYANKLAVNAAGQWVMEPKGGGDVFSVDKDKVEEVIPYTVDVKFWGSSNTYAYTSVEGKYSVGDILVVNTTYNAHGVNFVVVKGVNTKSKKATKELEPIGRVQVEKV